MSFGPGIRDIPRGASLADLPGVAKSILAAFQAQLTEMGVALPDRQYVAPGAQSVWDAEELFVALMGIAQGQPGLAFTQTFTPPTAAVYWASFGVHIVRAIATVNTDGFAAVEVPTADQMTESGLATMEDGAALVLAAQEIHQTYQLTGPGEGFVVDGLQPIGPEGGFVASRLLVSVSLS